MSDVEREIEVEEAEAVAEAVEEPGALADAAAEVMAVADSDATIVSDASRDDVRKNMSVNMREKAARLKG